MPRQSQTPINTRTQVKQQDTFRFTEKGKVDARPVDAFEQQYASKEAQGILEALNLGAESATSINTSLKRVNLSNNEVGKQLALRGEPLPVDPNEHVLAGFRKQEGEGNAYDYKNALISKLSLQLDPEEYAKQRKEITDSFLQGKSDSWKQGFVPKAFEAEKAHELEYTKAQKEKLQSEWLANGSKSFLGTLASNGGDPEQARQAITTLQDQGVMFDLDKTQVGKGVVRAMSVQAEMYGRPELFDFAWKPDANGIKMIDTEIGHEIFAAREKALKSQEHSNVMLEKQKKDAVEDAEMSIVKAIASGDKGTARQLLNQYTQPDSPIKVTSEKYEHYMKAMKDDESGDGFAKKSDMGTYYKLKVQASQGGLAIEDLSKQQGRLSHGDFKELLNDTIKPKDDNDKGIDTFVSKVASSFEPGMMERRSPDDKANAKTRSAMYQIKMQENLSKFKQEKKRYPDSDELLKVSESTKKEVYTIIPRRSVGAPLKEGGKPDILGGLQKLH